MSPSRAALTSLRVKSTGAVDPSSTTPVDLTYCPTEGQLAAGDQRANLGRTTGHWTTQRMLRLTIDRRVSNLIDRWIELALNS